MWKFKSVPFISLGPGEAKGSRGESSTILQLCYSPDGAKARRVGGGENNLKVYGKQGSCCLPQSYRNGCDLVVLRSGLELKRHPKVRAVDASSSRRAVQIAVVN